MLVALAGSQTADLTAILKDAGLRCVSEPPSGYRVLDGDSAYLVSAVSDGSTTVGVQFWRIVRTKGFVSHEELDKWSATQSGKWETCLSQTVYSSHFIKVSDLKSGFADLRAQWRAFQVTFPVSKNLPASYFGRPAGDPPIDENLNITQIGIRDFEYFSRRLHWEPRINRGGSGPGWWIPIKVGKVTFWAASLWRRVGNEPGFALKSENLKPSRNLSPPLFKVASLDPGPPPRLRYELKFGHEGVTVGRILDAVRAFANDVRAYERNLKH